MSDAQRFGDWMQTYTGLRFYVMDPRPEDVTIEDIAHALALQCRYNGHCRDFYSVAQHSVLVSHVVEQAEREKFLASPMTLVERQRYAQLIITALLHDASEAYLGDMVRPLKRHQPSYKRAEVAVDLAILRRMRLPLEDFAGVELIKQADNILLATERRDLMTHELDWDAEELLAPLEERIEPLSPEDAEQMFLGRFRSLQTAALAAGLVIYP